jgi:hypothetical protein
MTGRLPKVDVTSYMHIIWSKLRLLTIPQAFFRGFLMQRRGNYKLRSAKLQTQLVGIADPVAQFMLRALIDALDEAAAEDLELAGQKPSSHQVN